MDNDQEQIPAGSSIAELYPELDDTAREEAQENLDAYLKLVIRICDRLRSDSTARAQPGALTGHCPEVGSEAKGRTPPETKESSTPT